MNDEIQIRTRTRTRTRAGGATSGGRGWRRVRGFGGLVAAALALTAAPAARAQDPDLARNLAATCAGCHGTHGQARGQMKPLAGVPAQKIVAALADFKSGAAAATVMHQIAKGYSDEQIRLVAGYFAAQPSKP